MLPGEPPSLALIFTGKESYEEGRAEERRTQGQPDYFCASGQLCAPGVCRVLGLVARGGGRRAGFPPQLCRSPGDGNLPREAVRWLLLQPRRLSGSVPRPVVALSRDASVWVLPSLLPCLA